MKFISLTERVHFYFNQIIKNGDCVLDATAGKGHDTLYLAKLVGDKGKVYAFDIQEEALHITEKRLIKAGMLERVILIQDSHDRLSYYDIPPLKAAVFNLGYLPGGDHSIITMAESTCQAISQLYKLIITDGIIIITSYREHAGGMKEYQALKDHLIKEESRGLKTTVISPLTENKNAPVIFIVQKEL